MTETNYTGWIIVPIKRKLLISGKERVRNIKMRSEDWELWNSDNPPFIQICFPYMSANDREFILSGCTADEFDDLFPEEV